MNQTLRNFARVHAIVLPALLAGCGSGTDTPVQVTTTSQARAASNETVTAETYHDVIQRFYLAYFGRPADAAGLDYWSVQYFERKFPTSVSAVTDAYAGDAMVRAFVDFYGASKESTDLYGGDNGAFVSAVYRNLFNREPEPVGRAFWLDKLDRNVMTRPVAAFQIMRGAQGIDIDVIEKKVAVAKRFSAALDTDLERGAYDGLAANASVRTMLAGVGLPTDPASFNVAPVLSALVANLGPARHYLGFTTGAPGALKHGILPALGGASMDFAPGLEKEGVVSFARDTAGSRQPDLTFWANKRLYRLPMTTYGAAPVPVLVSSITQDQVCDTTGMTFDDYQDHTRSYRVFHAPGRDGRCSISDYGYVAVRMDMSSTTPALPTEQPLFATRSSAGALNGFLVWPGPPPPNTPSVEVKRVNADFANPRPVFEVGFGLMPNLVPHDTVRRTGNIFVYNEPQSRVLMRDTDGNYEPLLIGNGWNGLFFGDVLLADDKTLYVAATTATNEVRLERYSPATGKRETVAQFPVGSYQTFKLHLTASYFVFVSRHGEIWVVPRAGGAARQLYKGAAMPIDDNPIQVAGERVWVTTTMGTVTIQTDGTGLVELPGALMTGCVYRAGVSISNNNDVCASMLLLHDNQLSGYNASSGAVDVRYGAVSSAAEPGEGGTIYHRANASGGIGGQGMLLTRYTTSNSFRLGPSRDLAHWHFVAGKPGLTRVAMP